MERDGFFIIGEGKKSTDLPIKVSRKRGVKDRSCQTNNDWQRHIIQEATQVLDTAFTRKARRRVKKELDKEAD